MGKTPSYEMFRTAVNGVCEAARPSVTIWFIRPVQFDAVMLPQISWLGRTGGPGVVVGAGVVGAGVVVLPMTGLHPSNGRIYANPWPVL